MMFKQADAEQAKETGGMLALIPHIDDATRYAVPGGEPVSDSHCTLFYFGEDVSGYDPSELIGSLQTYFDGGAYSEFDEQLVPYPVINARLFSHALFNPDGANDRDPCAVYLVGDTKTLVPMRNDLLAIVNDWTMTSGFDLPEQHEPYHPHVTAGYGIEIDWLEDPGPIIFDQVALHWAGEIHSFWLTD